MNVKYSLIFSYRSLCHDIWHHGTRYHMHQNHVKAPFVTSAPKTILVHCSSWAVRSTQWGTVCVVNDTGCDGDCPLKQVLEQWSDCGPHIKQSAAVYVRIHGKKSPSLVSSAEYTSESRIGLERVSPMKKRTVIVLYIPASSVKSSDVKNEGTEIKLFY